MNNIAIITMLSRLDQLQAAGWQIKIETWERNVVCLQVSKRNDVVGYYEAGQLTKVLPGLVAQVWGETQCSVECAGEAP